MSAAAETIHAIHQPAVGAASRAQSFAKSRAVDPIAFAEAAIAGVLSLVCVNPHIRRRLGLTAASRRADGWPAWYLWLAGSPGAYELALVPHVADGCLRTGGPEFALRYFPHPEESVFSDFASIERETRCSALFDHTGSPAVETIHDLDPSLFHIAMLSLCPSPIEDRIDLTLDAQDVWLETMDTVSGPQVRRRVPGLSLAAPIVDLLVCARAYYGRHPPTAFAITLENGVAWHVDSTGAGRPSSSPETSLFTLRVEGLPALGIPALETHDDVEPAHRAGNKLICRHDGTHAPQRVAPFATDAWWKAATWRFYPVGAMCGCQIEDTTVIGREPDAEPRRRIRR